MEHVLSSTYHTHVWGTEMWGESLQKEAKFRHFGGASGKQSELSDAIVYVGKREMGQSTRGGERKGNAILKVNKKKKQKQ